MAKGKTVHSMRYSNIKQNKTNHFTLGAIDNLMTKDSSILFTCSSHHSPASRRRRSNLTSSACIKSSQHPPCNALHPAGDGSIEPEKPYYVKREAVPCVRNPRIDWQEASNLHVLAIPGFLNLASISSIPYVTSEKDRDRRLRCTDSILTHPLDSLDSRPRWNKAFDNGSVRAILLNRPNAWRPSPERVNRLMNSTLNGSRLRKTWVLWSWFMSLNLDRGDVTNVGLINLWMLVLRSCRRAT
jgi:hypothetical protein